jgi:hypothetical protein
MWPSSGRAIHRCKLMPRSSRQPTQRQDGFSTALGRGRGRGHGHSSVSDPERVRCLAAGEHDRTARNVRSSSAVDQRFIDRRGSGGHAPCRPRPGRRFKRIPAWSGSGGSPRSTSTRRVERLSLRREGRIRLCPPAAHREGGCARLQGFRGVLVEVGGIEPPSPGDRSGLLRAQPVGRSRLEAPTGGGPLGQPGFDVRRGPRAEPLP